jgi:recombination protein RecA
VVVGAVAGRDAGRAREERLERALEALRERFGEWVVYRLRDARPAIGEKVVSTGSLGLDRATGVGGAPRGRVTELTGPPTSGKSTLASHILANAQANGGFAALIDADHAADLDRLRTCGVDLGDLLLAVPRGAREAMDIACLLAASGGLDALVISSANALVRGPLGHAQAFTAGLRRLVVELGDAPTAAVFVVHSEPGWRSTANAARALAHAASLRVACTPLDLVTHPSGEALGLRLRAEVAKNKLAAPHRTAELEVLRDRGLHAAAEAFDLGLADGLVSAGPGSLGYRFGDAWLGRGRAPAIRALDADPALLSALRGALLERGGATRG